MTDAELFERFARDQSGDAFATLVQRHVDLVYSVARRHVGSPAAAEDVAQAVFIELAQNARRIRSGTPLVAWLHVVSRRTALNAVRTHVRRQQREQAAVEIAAMSSPSPDWSAIEPLLDEAVESLAPADRAAVLLRFFENKSLREVGALTGASEDAAQKRVSRALEQLRAFFVRRGVSITAGSLTTSLSAHVITPAPPALAAALASAAVSAPALPLAFSKTLLLATTSKAFVSLVAVLAIGGALFEARTLHAQRAEITSTQQSLHALELRLERERATRVATDREISAALAASQPTPARPANYDPAAAAEIKAWLARVEELKRLAQTPGRSIPEMALLSQKDWLSLSQYKDLRPLDDPLVSIRSRAAINFGLNLMHALHDFVKAHDGQLPASARELGPYFSDNSQFQAAAVTEAMLDRYVIRYSGKASNVPKAEQGAVWMESTSVDEEKDQRIIGGVDNARISDFRDLTDETRYAQRAYAAAKGTATADPYDLLPYFKPALSPVRQANFLQSSDSLLTKKNVSP